MDALVTQWGNSLGLRIPKQFAQTLAVKSGDRVTMTLENNCLVIQPIRIHLAKILARITPDNLPDSSDCEAYGIFGSELW